MNIKQHVPSLATCKKLQETGWQKQTIFEYRGGNIDGFDVGIVDMSIKGITCFHIPAPILSELLVSLPMRIHYTDEGCRHIQITRDSRGYSLWYTKEHYANHQNPAEAAAQLVLTLVEEGILTL